MTPGQIIREVAAGFGTLYAIAFFLAAWITMASLGPSNGFAFVLLAIVAATLSGVAGWWLTRRRLWFYLGVFISSVSVLLSLAVAVRFEEPMIGGLPPPFGAVLMAGMPLLAYLVPRLDGPTRSTP